MAIGGKLVLVGIVVGRIIQRIQKLAAGVRLRAFGLIGFCSVVQCVDITQSAFCLGIAFDIRRRNGVVSSVLIGGMRLVVSMFANSVRFVSNVALGGRV